MPLFYQHNFNETTKLAVWQIREPETFFLQKVHLQKEINNPHKRLQHLAGRYLLRILHPEFPLHLIEIADSKKPLLPNEDFHFSISHCGDFAAAIISSNQSVGIDVEVITPKIEKVKNRFLLPNEINMLPAANPAFLTLCWSCKEAVYKWYGKGQLSFKNNIRLTDIAVKENTGITGCRFVMNSVKELKIHFHLFENICLAWVTG
jgi:phosphopantetheine--protein transferase-like protein